MSHKQRNLLNSIFQDPLRSNIHWREVESLLHHLGATVEPILGARFRVLLNQHEFILHRPHQGNVCSKQDIKHLRDCLSQAGISLSSYDQP
ncbi:hypothetical protein [Pseudomonas zhanjiangensis]|uniref:HicA toxin of toxin-antitoxin n=1 Tax=Pseudomonas zhanjiangensis TaxID=3239015 RepID=A0ABV3YVT0_9PSED